MKVTIELIRKPGENPFYYVSSETSGVRCFSFKDDAPEGDIWNKQAALNAARECALIFKSGVETRELIETL